MTTYTKEQLAEILRLHGIWLRGEDGGVQADLRGADLRGANLRWADLREADLSWANLRWADLREADLSVANLRWADLREANLREVNLSGADLRGAELYGAELYGSRCRSLPSDRYRAYTVPSEEGQILHYGCERRTLDDWEANVAAICKQHVPDNADRYETEVRALIAYCRIVEKEAT